MCQHEEGGREGERECRKALTHWNIHPQSKIVWHKCRALEDFFPRIVRRQSCPRPTVEIFFWKQKEKTGPSQYVQYEGQNQHADSTCTTKGLINSQHVHHERHTQQSARAPRKTYSTVSTCTTNDIHNSQHVHHERHTQQSTRAPRKTYSTVNTCTTKDIHTSLHVHHERYTQRSTRAPRKTYTPVCTCTTKDILNGQHEHHEIHTQQSRRALQRKREVSSCTIKNRINSQHTH